MGTSILQERHSLGTPGHLMRLMEVLDGENAVCYESEGLMVTNGSVMFRTKHAYNNCHPLSSSCRLVPLNIIMPRKHQTPTFYNYTKQTSCDLDAEREEELGLCKVHYRTVSSN